MSDKEWWTEECPKCHKQTLEVFEQTGALIHSERCSNPKCLYDAKTYFYERKDGTIELRRGK